MGTPDDDAELESEWNEKPWLASQAYICQLPYPDVRAVIAEAGRVESRRGTWPVCAARAVSIIDYPTSFEAIRTASGTSDGPGSFYRRCLNPIAPGIHGILRVKSSKRPVTKSARRAGAYEMVEKGIRNVAAARSEIEMALDQWPTLSEKEIQRHWSSESETYAPVEVLLQYLDA